MSDEAQRKAERDKRPRGVLDPQWEDALRAGQAEEGNAGSVEDELAVVHLLRHAAAPDALSDAAFEQIWSDVAAEVAPAPWWKKLLDWRVAGPALAVAAAAVVVVIVWPKADEATVPAPQIATNVVDDHAPPGLVGDESPAAVLEAQFEILAPAARDGIARTVDDGRGAMRADLLALAVGDGKTVGGAP